MRETIFRGKHIFTKQWLYGSVIIENDGMHSIFYYDKFGCSGSSQIDKNTLGQFTGLTDKNGVKVFDGDIIQGRDTDYLDGHCISDYLYKAVVIWDENNGKWVASSDDDDDFDLYDFDFDEVIGNIHDTKNLLEQNND
jgi:uncharacterized phage protein (TIGR01671 family)